MTKPCLACAADCEFTALRCSKCGFKFESEGPGMSPEKMKIRGKGLMQIFYGLALAAGCILVGMFLSLILSFLSPGDHFKVFASLGGIGALISIHGVFRIVGTLESPATRLAAGLAGLLFIGGGYIAFVLNAPFK